MVREFSKEHIEKTAERVWALAQDALAQCYPLPESAEDFARTLNWAMEERCGSALACWQRGKLSGVCCLFINDEERYVQIIALYDWGDASAAADAFLSRIDREYPKHTIDAGIAGKNVRLADALARHGYRIVDDCIDLRHALPAEDTGSRADGDLTLISDENLGEYAALHDDWFPGFYWNAACLRARAGDWAVLAARRDGKIAGSILIVFGRDLAEIYGLHAANGAMARALIDGALKHCSSRATRFGSMRWMADVANKTNVRAALSCGFAQTGSYVGWRKNRSDEA